jgi:hypothetical protein
MEHVGKPQIVYVPKPNPRRYPVQIPQRLDDDDKPIPVILPRRQDSERVTKPVVPSKG